MEFKIFILTAIVLIVSGCSVRTEYVMPFRNFMYSGERLFPVAENDDEFTFRASVNNSTSIDRIFTVSYGKTFGYRGKLLEVEARQAGKHKEDKTTFKQVNITPNSGFEKFIREVDSLNLMDTKTQLEANFTPALHQPFSLYVIEIKSHGKVNQFRFNTYYPAKDKVDGKYNAIEDLIMREFNFHFYFKTPKNQTIN